MKPLSAHSGARHQSIVTSMQPLWGVIIWSMSIHKQPCKAACKQPCETPCGHAQDTRAIRTAPTRESPENATARSSPSHGHRTRTRTPQPQPAQRHQKTPATATPPPIGTEKSWGCSPLTYIQSKNPTTQALFGEFWEWMLVFGVWDCPKGRTIFTHVRCSVVQIK